MQLRCSEYEGLNLVEVTCIQNLDNFETGHPALQKELFALSTLLVIFLLLPATGDGGRRRWPQGQYR